MTPIKGRGSSRVAHFVILGPSPSGSGWSQDSQFLYIAKIMASPDQWMKMKKNIEAVRRLYKHRSLNFTVVKLCMLHVR